MNDSVRYELDGHVATITYNRPEALNAVNGDMRRGLNDAFGRFRDDEDGAIAAEYIVLVGLAIVAAVVVGGVLWSKLKTGANDTTVPSPAAP